MKHRAMQIGILLLLVYGVLVLEKKTGIFTQILTFGGSVKTPGLV